MTIGNTSLGNLAKLRHDVRRERVSSWNRTGNNQDNLILAPNEARTIFDVSGPGCIKHIFMAMMVPEEFPARKVALRMWWDGEDEETPSVEVPIGDFFGIGHGILKKILVSTLDDEPSSGQRIQLLLSNALLEKGPH